MHVDSDVHRSDIATHSLLGGQHGEESEESEEGQEGKEEEGEEVTFLSERRIRQSLSNAASQRPARPDGAQCCSEWPRRSWSTTEGVGKTKILLHGTDDRVRPRGRTTVLVDVRASRRARHSRNDPSDDLGFSPTPSVFGALALQSASLGPRNAKPPHTVRGLACIGRRQPLQPFRHVLMNSL